MRIHEGITRRIASVTLFMLPCVPCALAQRVDGELDRLQRKWQAAFDQDNLDLAIEIGLDRAQRAPANPQPAYDLARTYGRAADPQNALEWLNRSAERGFYFVSTLLRDPDLDDIRSKAEYAAVLVRIRQNSAERLEKFKSKADGATIITVLPPMLDKARPSPLMVALHGYGSDAQDMASTWRDAAAKIGAILIAPQALDPAGQGFSWGVVEQGEYLVLRAIEIARKEHNIDPKRIVVTGFSQGGGMTYTLAIRHPELFAGAIPVAGYYEHRVDPIPSQPGRLPRFVIMCGEKDQPVKVNRDAASRLEAIGVPLQLRIYPNLGHRFPPNRQAEMDSALQFVLQE